MAAEAAEEMGAGAGAAVGEKGPATADRAMGKTGRTEEEKGDAAADKEKGSTAEKEEKGATAGNEEEGEEEERAKAEQKGENRPASAKRGHKKKAEAGEMEGMFTCAVITLESSDGMLFTVSEEAARLSVPLADMIDQGCAGGIIQLPNVDARALDTVIEYCNKHADAASSNSRVDEGSSSCNSEASEEALMEWDRKLVDGLSQDALCDVIIAAKFLHIKGLLDAACQKVAVVDMVNCKTPEQMHQIEEEDMCTWFSGLTPFSEKGTAAAEGARRGRTVGQRPEEKGAMAEETEQVAGENDTFFFRASGKIITLKSSDGMLFKVSEAAARLSVLLADMIDQGCAKGIIQLPNVDARALVTVIEYCNEHAASAATANPDANHGVAEGSSSCNSEASGEALKEWDRKLVDGLSQDALYDLIMAVNFLHIKGLLDAACQKVADMIKGKSVEQTRKMFGIATDFTEEEEEELRKESPWAFEE
ncbi:SKP1-like protein 11 [Triticum urartu]|uniref:SKP1-like protein 11 n=1 Tax=Triticum urartu TaxID=4572 RepID=M8A1S3_TRIUA|nr:SKP1-like protein 11 [Triticum urartu]